MSDDQAQAGTTEPKRAFQSRLERGRERFLAYAIEHAFETGLRTPQDFIRHFPPSVIMEGLAEQARLRAAILVLTTGLKQKIAEKKSWESAAEDLQIALDEGETDAESVVAVFDPDDRVRYLDSTRIWRFLAEGDFWNAGVADKPAHGLAKDNVAFMLERALGERLITHRDVVEGITVAELAKRLPKAELGKIIEGALTKAKSNSPFSEADLLREMPPFVLVEYVPLPHIWDTVVSQKIAAAHGYVAAAPPPPVVETADAAPAAAPTESLAPNSQDWVDVGGSDAPPPLDGGGDDDEISDDDFAMP